MQKKIYPINNLPNYILILIWIIISIKVSFLFKLDSWSTGDWLINYENGFVRRGLIGHCILFFYDIFDGAVPISSFVISIKLFCYLIIAIGFVLMINKSKNALIFFILILSPPGLAFNFWDYPGSGRKEIIIFAFASIIIILKNLNFINLFIYGFIAGIIVFIHEGLFFFLPFIFLLLLNKNNKFVFLNVFKFFIFPFIAICFSLINIGDAVSVEKICISLTSRGLDKEICNAAIADIKGRLPFRDFIYNDGHYSFYLVAFIFSLMPILIILNNECKNILYKILVCWILTAPLYLLAGDWGRWIHISYILTIFIIFGSNLIIFNLNRSILLFLIFIFLISSFWYLPRCCFDFNYFKNNFSRLNVYNPNHSQFLFR